MGLLLPEIMPEIWGAIKSITSLLAANLEVLLYTAQPMVSHIADEKS